MQFFMSIFVEMPKISNERGYILVQTYVGIIFMVALSPVFIVEKKIVFF